MDFGSVITAMVTPFSQDGQVNYQMAEELVQYLLANGSDSVLINGTTGESPTLSKEEKLAMMKTAVQAAKGKGKVIAGTTNYNTAESIAMTKEAESTGIDAILAVTPYYNKPPQEGLVEHFTAIAQSTSLPIFLYNIPSRTNCNLLPETVLSLSKVDNIVGIKESSGNVNQVAEIIRMVDDDFVVYSGDDSMILPYMSLGARGIFSVASHLKGLRIKEMVLAFRNNDLKTAQEIYYELLPMFNNLFVTTNPIPIKYCLNRVNMYVGPCRPPMTGMTNSERSILDKMLASYGLEYKYNCC